MYTIISSTDNKNIGKTFEKIPEVGEIIVLEQKYNFRVDYINKNNDEYILSNANYVLIVKKV